jgi:hypothetical protein
VTLKKSHFELILLVKVYFTTRPRHQMLTVVPGLVNLS